MLSYKRHLVVVSAVLLQLGFGSVVLAEPDAGKRREFVENLKKADVDGSGGLTKSELEKAGPDAFPGLKKNFDVIDANRDGELTIPEIQDFMKERRKR